MRGAIKDYLEAGPTHEVSDWLKRGWSGYFSCQSGADRGGAQKHYKYKKISSNFIILVTNFIKIIGK